MITEINKAAAQKIGEAAFKALEEVAKNLGLTVEPGRGTFDPTIGEFTAKFTFKTETSAKAKWDQSVHLLRSNWGLNEEPWLKSTDFGRELPYKGDTITLTGINLKASKFPIQGTKKSDGKTYGFPEASIKQLIAFEAKMASVRDAAKAAKAVRDAVEAGK